MCVCRGEGSLALPVTPFFALHSALRRLPQHPQGLLNLSLIIIPLLYSSTPDVWRDTVSSPKSHHNLSLSLASATKCPDTQPIQLWYIFLWKGKKQSIPHLASFLLLFCKIVKIHGEAKAMITFMLPPVGFLFPSRGRGQSSHLWVSVLRKPSCQGLWSHSSCHSKSVPGSVSFPFFTSILSIFPSKQTQRIMESKPWLSLRNSLKKNQLCKIKKKIIAFIFYSSFGFYGNLSQQYRELPYIPMPLLNGFLYYFALVRHFCYDW